MTNRLPDAYSQEPPTLALRHALDDGDVRGVLEARRQLAVSALKARVFPAAEHAPDFTPDMLEGWSGLR